MKKITQQQMTNLLFARGWWPTIPAESVDLHNWTVCGTLHCFGGWVALEKFFQDQGIHPGATGAPKDSCVILNDPWDIGDQLFGQWGMFEQAGLSILDTNRRLDWSDHELVTRRIQLAIENSYVED